MLNSETPHPFPDYVTCPYCGELEVEVWCYRTAAQCHACGRSFQHALPAECVSRCDRAACEVEQPRSPNEFA